MALTPAFQSVEGLNRHHKADLTIRIPTVPPPTYTNEKINITWPRVRYGTNQRLPAIILKLYEPACFDPFADSQGDE